MSGVNTGKLTERATGAVLSIKHTPLIAWMSVFSEGSINKLRCCAMYMLSEAEIRKIIADSIKELNEMQAKHNDGRGISCVKSVIVHLERGDAWSAKRIVHNDWDKISGYPDVAVWLQRNDFADRDWHVQQ